MKHEISAKDYYIQRSLELSELEDMNDFQDFIMDDPYLMVLLDAAIYQRSKNRRLRAIIRIILYIRGISMMAGFRDGVRRYERERI